jgi:hypothetical protein
MTEIIRVDSPHTVGLTDVGLSSKVATYMEDNRTYDVSLVLHPRLETRVKNRNTILLLSTHLPVTPFLLVMLVAVPPPVPPKSGRHQPTRKSTTSTSPENVSPVTLTAVSLEYASLRHKSHCPLVPSLCLYHRENIDAVISTCSLRECMSLLPQRRS